MKITKAKENLTMDRFVKQDFHDTLSAQDDFERVSEKPDQRESILVDFIDAPIEVKP